MTSSERHLRSGQSRWNYEIQKYKDFRDVFSEKGLVSVLFLACGRPEITRRCLLSTVDAVTNYSKPLEWIFIENGNDEENYQFFKDLNLERKVIVRQPNGGINEGLNQAWALSRGEFCLIHENDWEARTNKNFLPIAIEVFNEKQDVAIIQLRAIWDPCENFGLFKEMYNPWSCDRSKLTKAKVYDEETKSGHKYFIGTGFYAFNNNPCLIRKKLYREIGYYPEAELGNDPAHGETFYQEEVLKTGCAAAQIGEIYYHVGQKKTNAT